MYEFPALGHIITSSNALQYSFSYPALRNSSFYLVVVDSNLRDLIFNSDKVDSVGDFDIRDGVPGFELEMVSGDSVWTPMRIRRPQQISPENSQQTNECMSDLSIPELSELDKVEFLGHDDVYAPGVILH